MKPVTFITGNLNKVKYLEKYLGHPLKHIKLDLDEIQSLDAKKIVEHKVRQAYEIVQEPILVEDASLEFAALGGLPGPFIKFFMENIPLGTICTLLNGQPRKAVARTTFGYFDGTQIYFFEGKLEGEIAASPAGENGWDWDRIFIPEGFSITRAQMNPDEYEKTSRQLRAIASLQEFFGNTKTKNTVAKG